MLLIGRGVSDTEYLRRLVLAIAIFVLGAVLCTLIWFHPEVILLGFGGVVGAILLDALARPLLRLGWPRGASIPVALALLLAILVGGFALAGPRLVDQGSTLLETVPQRIAGLRDAISGSELGRTALSAAEAPGSAPAWQRFAPFIFGSITTVFSTAFGAAASSLALLALAVFLSLQPQLYVGGALQLFPRRRRRRLREVLDAAAHAVRRWLVGRCIAMAAVGGLTYLGLVLLGVPLALTLGLIAGVLTFVPYLGPIVSAVPALLVASQQGADAMLWVALLYTGIQLVENYLITPIVQGRATSLPPALLLLVQAMMGVLFGVAGLLLATPLLVVAVVAIQALYVRDVLGEPVDLLGEGGKAGWQARFSRS
jgi:predicted PurR-regulated permease PerM